MFNILQGSLLMLPGSTTTARGRITCGNMPLSSSATSLQSSSASAGALDFNNSINSNITLIIMLIIILLLLNELIIAMVTVADMIPLLILEIFLCHHALIVNIIIIINVQGIPQVPYDKSSPRRGLRWHPHGSPVVLFGPFSLHSVLSVHSHLVSCTRFVGWISDRLLSLN